MVSEAWSKTDPTSQLILEQPTELKRGMTTGQDKVGNSISDIWAAKKEWNITSGKEKIKNIYDKEKFKFLLKCFVTTRGSMEVIPSFFSSQDM